MGFVKFILVLMLCVPIIYLSISFAEKLIADLQEQQIFTERLRRPNRQSEPYDYNFKYVGQVDSKRNLSVKSGGGGQQKPKKKKGVPIR